MSTAERLACGLVPAKLYGSSASSDWHQRPPLMELGGRQCRGSLFQVPVTCDVQTAPTEGVPVAAFTSSPREQLSAGRLTAAASETPDASCGGPLASGDEQSPTQHLLRTLRCNPRRLFGSARRSGSKIVDWRKAMAMLRLRSTLQFDLRRSPKCHGSPHMPGSRQVVVLVRDSTVPQRFGLRAGPLTLGRPDRRRSQTSRAPPSRSIVVAFRYGLRTM